MKILSILCLFLGLPYACLSGEENFILINNNTGNVVLELGPNVNERVTPCSSFKIALSLMGYDAKILQDNENPIWNFQEGYVDYIDSWKTAQTPQSWIKNSCVWYSQILTSQLGIEKVQDYLRLLEYGNQDISGGLTSAWLSSSLKISPKEQLKFLQKMFQPDSSLSNNAIKTTKSLLFIGDLSEGWKLFGKTGFGNNHNLEIGWFVGWLEKEETVYIFAYNMQNTKVDPTQRVPRVKQLLIDSLTSNKSEEK